MSWVFSYKARDSEEAGISQLDDIYRFWGEMGGNFNIYNFVNFSNFISKSENKNLKHKSIYFTKDVGKSVKIYDGVEK